MRRLDGDASAAHDDDLLHLRVQFAGLDADILDVFAGGGDKDDVARFDMVHTAGDNHLAFAALYGHDVVALLVVLHQLHQRAIDNRRPAAHLNAEQDESTAEEFPVLSCPRPTDGCYDFFGRQDLGADHGVDADLLEELIVARQEVLMVVDAGEGLACAEVAGQHAGRDVGRLFGGDADEEVGIADVGVLQIVQRGGITDDGQDLHAGLGEGQIILIGVKEDDVVAFARKHFRQVAAYLAGARNDDSHAWPPFCPTRERMASRMCGASMPQRL